ncbi:hypothetical protein GF373_05425 [bacterium]|nr:hypothetical protein [bacterium]
MAEPLGIEIAPWIKYTLCCLIFLALFVVYWWEPGKPKKKDKTNQPNCVELDPQMMAAKNTDLLQPPLEKKKHPTQHVTLELLDEYAKELKRQNIKSFDEV